MTCDKFSSVIRRLMTLLAAQATLAATSEAAMRQATSASKAAEELMAQKDKSASDENIKEAEEKISQLKEELANAKKGKIAILVISCKYLKFLFPQSGLRPWKILKPLNRKAKALLVNTIVFPKSTVNFRRKWPS